MIAIKQELTNVDVLVCGLCHIGFHFVEEFQEHKDGGCNKVSAFRVQHNQSTQVLKILILKIFLFVLLLTAFAFGTIRLYQFNTNNSFNNIYL